MLAVLLVLYEWLSLMQLLLNVGRLVLQKVENLSRLLKYFNDCFNLLVLLPYLKSFWFKFFIKKKETYWNVVLISSTRFVKQTLNFLKIFTLYELCRSTNTRSLFRAISRYRVEWDVVGSWKILRYKWPRLYATRTGTRHWRSNFHLAFCLWSRGRLPDSNFSLSPTYNKSSITWWACRYRRWKGEVEGYSVKNGYSN